MPRLAIIHTNPVTVETLKALAAEIMPGYEVVNFVDDSILPQLMENGGDVSEVEDRLTQYARIAEQVGADVILNACSSIGEVVPAMQGQVSVPVVRVDEAMAEAAIQRGGTIGVAATIRTTLQPTMRLLEGKAADAGKTVQLVPRLVSAAYERLTAGDRDGHDTLLAEALQDLAGSVDVVVLAQASMARVLPRLPSELQPKFLSSPRLAVERVKSAVETAQA